MFAVYVGSILTTLYWLASFSQASFEARGFTLAISVWLWFTVLFANFAEAIAEGHGKAQAASLKKSRSSVPAYRLTDVKSRATVEVSSTDLKVDDLILVKAGEAIPPMEKSSKEWRRSMKAPSRGKARRLSARVAETAAPSPEGHASFSDWLIVRVKTLPGQSFLDRMIAMVEGAKRQKTPNEIALAILLAALTLIFLLVVATLLPFSQFAVQASGQGRPSA